MIVIISKQSIILENVYLSMKLFKNIDGDIKVLSGKMGFDDKLTFTGDKEITIKYTKVKFKKNHFNVMKEVSLN